MSNLNLELIEKVRKGEACIEHTQFKEDNDKLKLVLLNAFPTSELAHYPFEKKYYGKSYIGSKADDWDIYVMGEEQTLEIIPLSAFFTNELPKEDKQLIGKIDELLGQLKTISQSVFELREHASLVLPDVAPIEQVEEVKRVVALVSDCGWKNSQRIIKGEKYDVEKDDGMHYYVNGFGFSKEKFAVVSQQEQPKWKEGEERFSVEVYQPTLTGDEGFKIHISPTFKMRKPMADEIATKIKALLATI